MASNREGVAVNVSERMRKIPQAVCSDFEVGRVRYIGNTHTDGNALYLHGNKIAERRGGVLWVTLAGWPTVTTRERLNGLSGVRVTQKKGVQYLNGVEWGGEWVAVA